MTINKKRITAAVSALTLVAAIATLPTFIANAEASKGTFGAIAYSWKTKSSGVGAGDTKAVAKKNALEFCEAKDCEVLVDYKDECASIAVGNGTFFGSGVGATKAEASKSAMDFCKESGTGCKIVTTDCAE